MATTRFPGVSPPPDLWERGAGEAAAGISEDAVAASDRTSSAPPVNVAARQIWIGHDSMRAWQYSYVCRPGSERVQRWPTAAHPTGWFPGTAAVA